MPPATSIANRVGFKTSGRISAVPLHDSFVLETFQQSNQTTTDVSCLKHYFDVLYRSLDFVYSVVMMGCRSKAARRQSQSQRIPCYNVVHPWETLVDNWSPIWDDALRQVNGLMKELNWKPPFDNHGDDDAVLFLLECIVNATNECSNHSTDASSTSNSIHCEDSILQHCPFAMLDVGYAAALQKSTMETFDGGISTRKWQRIYSVQTK